MWGAWIEIYGLGSGAAAGAKSPPLWGAWIEIISPSIGRASPKSPPLWGAWIEMGHGAGDAVPQPLSPPLWGAWIEILITEEENGGLTVAPLVGGVD